MPNQWTKSDENDPARAKAQKLGLYGLLDHWNEVKSDSWVPLLMEWEERERLNRSMQRRIHAARIGRFKPMADFDWSWPKEIDREQIEDFFDLKWVQENQNLILLGPNGIGKTMIAQNLAYEAVLRGHTVRFTSASHMLNELVSLDGPASLRRRLSQYCNPQLLCIDEVGYLSYDNRHADLLYEVISQRYGKGSVLITTNKTFQQWNEVFPSAGCLVTLVDRLIHHAEIAQIDGQSYRRKEAEEQAARKAQERATRRRKRKASEPLNASSAVTSN